jgi:nicotinamide riboside kinase
MPIKEFQRIYFEIKKTQERSLKNFITDRSFADAFGYLQQKTQDTNYANELEQHYKHENEKYDFIIYLPFGIIPFEDDGHRSTDMAQHEWFSNRIKQLHATWQSTLLLLDNANLSIRVEKVIKYIQENYH